LSEEHTYTGGMQFTRREIKTSMISYDNMNPDTMNSVKKTEYYISGYG
jgi:hypothetical protein